MNLACSDCQSDKALLTCGVCGALVCKACATFADAETMPFLEPVPSYFEHGVFCHSCFVDKIEPETLAYTAIVERARVVDIFYKSQSKESRFIRRSEKPIRVKDCVDQHFAILKLAFLAARQGFNILLDVEVESEKVRNGGWQTSNWQAVGTPGLIDPQKLNRRFVGSPN